MSPSEEALWHKKSWAVVNDEFSSVSKIQRERIYVFSGVIQKVIVIFINDIQEIVSRRNSNQRSAEQL